MFVVSWAWSDYEGGAAGPLWIVDYEYTAKAITERCEVLNKEFHKTKQIKLRELNLDHEHWILSDKEDLEGALSTYEQHKSSLDGSDIKYQILEECNRMRKVGIDLAEQGKFRQDFLNEVFDLIGAEGIFRDIRIYSKDRWYEYERVDHLSPLQLSKSKV